MPTNYIRQSREQGRWLDTSLSGMKDKMMQNWYSKKKKKKRMLQEAMPSSQIKSKIRGRKS